MNEQGLATGTAGQIDPAMVQQVVEALMGGMAPEELIAQGVPAEVVDMAVQQLMAAQGQQGLAQPQGPMGGGIAQEQGLV